MLASLSPRRRRLVLGVVALAAAVAVALGAMAVGERWWPRRGPTGAATGAPPERPGPVVLVPGYGGGRAALEVLAARLRQAGREAHVMPLPGDGTGDLRAQAAHVDATVTALLGGAGSARSASSVDLVGFSAGGVVVRLWVAEYGGAARARRIVTLGSPHHGADLAATAAALLTGSCPPACRQLAPGSPLLARLNAGDETPDGPQWFSVWTAQDSVVTPPESARLDGAVDVRLQSVCGDAQVSHGALPRDPLVTGIVLQALGVGPPTAPAPRDCAALRALGAASSPRPSS